MTNERGAKETDLAGLVGRGLDLLAGAVLVLDDQLHIRTVSPEVERVLGSVVPLGASAPAFLCGDHAHRPVAELLAAGKAVEAVIPRPGGDGFVRVRGLPLGAGAAGRGGFLLLLDDAEGEAAEVPELFHGMWSCDARMKRLFRLIEKVAVDDVSVLVRGETGAGKELVAAALHACSARRAKPFRAINCAALPAALLDSELFGHVRGAFTGAVRDTPGHIQLASGGTLFLDEVAEVPPELQAKLLRVLETHTVIPVGAREPVHVDVRIVSATHRSLRAEVDRGRFRADLMYRLRVIPLFLPPLRDRPNDIPLLVDKLVAQMNARSRRTIRIVDPAFVHALQRFPFHGNVRELKNVLAYAFAVGDGDRLSLEDLPQEVLDAGLGLGDVVAPPARAPTEEATSVEGRRVARALERTNGNRDQAAKLLGISRVTLWRRLRELGLASPPRGPQ